MEAGSQANRGQREIKKFVVVVCLLLKKTRTHSAVGEMLFHVNLKLS